MMMRALILYASYGGQTEQVAKRMASRMIEEGAAVDLYDVIAGSADAIAVDTYDAVVLGSYSYDGRRDARIDWCVSEYRPFLREVPTAFFSVSHPTAHGCNGRRREETRGVDDFLDRAAWQLSMNRMCAGTERNDRSVTQRLMRWLFVTPGKEPEIRSDGDSIDWEVVDEFARRFACFIFSCKQPPDTGPRFTAWRVHPKHEYSVAPQHR